jgi:hypothetical protein
MNNLASKTKYLTNRNILEEIHKSKVSYCSYLDPAYVNYDFIVDDLKQVTKKRIEEARRKKLADLTSIMKKENISKGLPADNISIKLKDIPEESIVVRLMTKDHIPLVESINAKTKETELNPLRCNFPPFQHYIRKNGELVCVLKSHWIGGLQNGHFSKDHGQMTKTLVNMFIKLVERYSYKSNWRGYCVDSETEALTGRGWLNIDHITASDKILSYNGSDTVWSNIKSIYKGEFKGKMHRLTTGNFDTLITPNHKLVTQRGLIPVEHVLQSDKVILMGPALVNEKTKHADEYIQLASYIIKFSNFDPTEIKIELKNKDDVANLESCLTKLRLEYSMILPKKRNFTIHTSNSKLKNIIGVNNRIMPAFIFELSSIQRENLIHLIFGSNPENKSFRTKYKDIADLLSMLCSISGYRTKIVTKNKIIHLKILSVRNNTVLARNIDFNGGNNAGKKDKTAGQRKLLHPNKPTKTYDGMVWCPETEYGCFIARRNGTVYLTGNTYLDEMKSQALLQLSQVGLQFDESRSSNPFAYYTQILTNSFRRILAIEKNHQNIRDDILIMNGVAPSYTRQTEDQINQNKNNNE